MQDLSNIPPLIYIIIISGLCVAVGYSVGFKDGHGEGYLRGRAIAKALKDKELSA
jgi:hypothetical protein